MNQYKLDNLNLYMSIDTLQIKSKSAIEFDSEKFPFVKPEIVRKSDNSFSYYRLNPDKGNNNIAIYNSFDYYNTLDYMLDSIALDMPLKSRIDFRFDSFDKNFNELLKLNKLLLLLISNKYKVNNRYKSQDLLTEEELTMRIQNKYIEVENYDKSLQEPDGDVMNRLELRSKCLDNDTPEIEKEYREFVMWCDRLDNAVTANNLNSLLRAANNSLADRYNEWTAKRGHKINGFLNKYENSIFTMKQLVDLYALLGIDKAENSAKNYKRRYDLEFFSLRDMQKYITKIKDSGAAFFGIE